MAAAVRAARVASGFAGRLRSGTMPLVQPHHLRPPPIVDMLTGNLVEATNDSLGAELPHVDLTDDFDEDALEEIKQASDDAGGILVFTNQRPDMTIHDLVRFATSMAESDGTVTEPHSVSKGHPDAPEVLEIVRDAGAKVVFGENWHSDNSFHDRTGAYSILRGAVVPRLGVNDTLFSSTEDAYDALPQDMQRVLLDLSAYHSANRAYGPGHGGNSRAAMEGTSSMQFRDEEELSILKYDVLQPVVTVHPRTGRKGLFASPTFTTHIEGMPAAESARLLQHVYEWIAQPQFCTRVSWRENQVVMWDNRSLSHKGLADEVGEKRVVQRVTIRGDAPRNHRGEQPSLIHRTRAASAGLF